MVIVNNKKVNRSETPKSTYSSSKKVCVADYLGVIPYERSLKLQQRLMQARAESSIPDVLLLLQHSPVFTIGRFKGGEDIIVPAEILIQEGIAVFHTNRGGGITYHGPGQLVGYPIINLKEAGLGVREYIWKLEEVIIRLLSALGIQGNRVINYPGAWVDKKKICSIGIHVSHGITMHGFALNINNDLRYFEYIRPCGLGSDVMTSLAKLLGRSIEVETIIGDLIYSFSEVFGFKCEQGDSKCLAMLDAPSG